MADKRRESNSQTYMNLAPNLEKPGSPGPRETASPEVRQALLNAMTGGEIPGPRAAEGMPSGTDQVARPGPEMLPRPGTVHGEALPGAPERPRIGKAEMAKAKDLLTKYRQGKTNLETRIIEDELWWELRHWETAGNGGSGVPTNTLRNVVNAQGQVHGDEGAGAKGPKPASGWLFNAILNKHADAMDNYPEAVVLPRERSDEESAKMLSELLPTVMEYNDFEQTYSDAWWEKLKHGTAVYGVFWNNEKENGLGDIDIVGIDLLRIFWEPGITNIQKSQNLFIVELADRKELEARYPEFRGKLDAGTSDLRQYLYDDTVDTSDKAVVVDWYYKVRGGDGKIRLHYVKYCGDCLLYASENDPAYRDRGFYDHGMYPVVFDVLFPEKGTPAGFGYVAVCKNPQMYIDAISANVLESSLMNVRKRFFVSTSTGINEQEFLDQSKPMVHVEGELDDRRIQEIVTQPVSGVYLNVMQMKIDEMKDTAANRDVNSGGATGSVTAAAAIAALQEAGNKASRDMIASSYRVHRSVSSLCVELMRQFYDERRAFRVTGPAGEFQFIDFSNEGIREQMSGTGADGMPMFRRPVFDLKVRAQKSNPFSRMEQNARATELFNMGFFQPERAQEVLGALEMMEFEGIDKVRSRVQEGQTLLRTVQELSVQMERMAALLGLQSPGQASAGSGIPPATGASVRGSGGRSGGTMDGSPSDAGGIMASGVPRSSYTERLVQRSTPNLEGGEK